MVAHEIIIGLLGPQSVRGRWGCGRRASTVSPMPRLVASAQNIRNNPFPGGLFFRLFTVVTPFYLLFISILTSFYLLSLE